MNRSSMQDVARTLARVDHFFSVDVARFTRRLRELDAEIDPMGTPVQLDDHHLQLEEAFQESQDACRRFEDQFGDDLVLLRDVQQGFRKETMPWFDHSWIAHRARTKPSGFAGDYEMLLKLYDEATPALGLGGYLDLCILNLPLARAVRARLAAAKSFLIGEVFRRSGTTRILDVACGPCREYLDWPKLDGQRTVQIVAMDNDPRVLDYANANIASTLPESIQLTAVRYNALRTRSADATVRRFGRFDIIYSVGLFDYLSDEQLIPILAGLKGSLNDDGVLYIAFKDCERYDKTPYQWHLDWHFYQRTVSQCLRLYDQAGFGMDEIRTSRDATGIIVIFSSQRRKPTFIRTDLPEGISAPLGIPAPIVINVEDGEFR